MAQISTNAYNSALNSWNTVLQNNTYQGSGYYIDVTLTPTNTQNGANVSLWDTTQQPIPGNYDGDTAGANAYTGYANDYSTLTNTVLYLSTNYDATADYITAAHEFGHALGLAHSQYQRSIMFPTLNNEACFSGPGDTNFDPTDTHFLEQQYDPRYVIKEPKNCHGCLARTSPIAGTRSAIAQRIARMPSSIPGHPRAHWVSAEDPLSTSTLSLSSLILASTLVAKVHVLDTVQITNHGPLRLVYKRAKITNILRHFAGPDSALSINQSVIIADTEMRNGDEFMDNLSINSADNPIVFLVRGNDFVQVGSQRYPVYHFTARFISKMTLLPNLTIAPLSVRNSYVAQQIRSKRVDMVLNEIAPGAVKGGVLDEQILMSALLRASGVTSLSDKERYIRGLTETPQSMLAELADRDARVRRR